jgi:hypothetical protein
MDVAGAEGGKAAVEGGVGFCGSEGGAFGLLDSGVGRVREALLETGELFDDGAGQAAAQPDEG